jgi:hypothetical protein
VLKTRSFETIMAELVATFEVHRAMGSRLGGVHCELTGAARRKNLTFFARFFPSFLQPLGSPFAYYDFLFHWVKPRPREFLS